MATTTMSACRVRAARSRERLWHTVTVAFAPSAFCISINASGLPTMLLQRAGHADVIAGLAFVLDVNLAGGIVADQDGGEAGPQALFDDETVDLGGNLGLHGLRQLFAVEELHHRRFISSGRVVPEGPR